MALMSYDGLTPKLVPVSLELSSVNGKSDSTSSSCKCFPGDACWPSETAWAAFNASVDGNLIATIPLAQPCHAPYYDQALCASMQANWTEPSAHYDSSSSIMAPFFTNKSCDPFTDPDTPCRLGNYVRYAVDVRKKEHISKALKFATEHNIRLVIRNTGHDYNGKSTGAGALGIWTHHLKDIQLKDYDSTYYKGKAFTLGAGVQGFDIYEQADANGLQVVGGECPSVGIAGGYTQGAGHSALSSVHGLAADQALEWEVMDGEGNMHTATRNHNPELYWALTGGGGGTYGVVWSLTLKAHPDTPTSGLNLTFTNANISQDTFFEAVGYYHSQLADIVDAGGMSVWSFSNTTFSIIPLTGPNIPKAKLLSLIAPFTNKLTSLGIAYTMHASQYPGYHQEFSGHQTPIPVGVAQYGGRLIPRSVVATNNDALTSAYRSIVSTGATFIGLGLNVGPSVVANDTLRSNSVNPAWRTTLIDSVITTPWNFSAPISEMLEWQTRMTDEFVPLLEALTPGGGCYSNEGDFRQPDWQRVFYGGNYARLREAKRLYDPNDVFYATTAVGADEWEVEGDGRLCRV
ncbi:FAD/FMN-containing isoamyl alcohol oxidase MreA [Saccharata proteae CBS 121410]|uniref:FAD/FMN-containing isoamyl alcohol oxidase MreA n=1 Tax=Saccharata proteae CBS 121410 TaxID=1314787 RepID=A0A9P4HN71_9PEZI|nr:FAD/FMN-containing isoamyl alcohol oxidase MreA [Saccharata proteae CBS 121410]